MAEITLRVENLITFSEAGRILGVSRPTVYNLITKYRLQPMAIGHNRYLLKEQVDFLKSEVEKSKEIKQLSKPTA